MARDNSALGSFSGSNLLSSAPGRGVKRKSPNPWASNGDEDMLCDSDEPTSPDQAEPAHKRQRKTFGLGHKRYLKQEKARRSFCFGDGPISDSPVGLGEGGRSCSASLKPLQPPSPMAVCRNLGNLGFFLPVLGCEFDDERGTLNIILQRQPDGPLPDLGHLPVAYKMEHGMVPMRFSFN